jgi:hypothetical protein
MSLTSSGRPGSFRRRGRAMMIFRHAAQPSSRQAAPPKMWTRTAAWLRFHTRHNVPRRAPSKRVQSAPSRRRARRSTTRAYSTFPSHQTAAHGLPALARHCPPSNTLCHRFIALSIGHLTRDSALMVVARRRAGATVGQTRTQPAPNRVASLGVRPFFRLCPWRRCRAVVACSSDSRYAWTEPCTTAARAGACPWTALVRLVAHGCARQTGLRSTRCPSPS